LRSTVEAETDRQAARPIDTALDVEEQKVLLAVLSRPAMEIAESGVVPYPNPMGLERFAE
jgi:hypothetical protein